MNTILPISFQIVFTHLYLILYCSQPDLCSIFFCVVFLIAGLLAQSVNGIPTFMFQPETEDSNKVVTGLAPDTEEIV